MHATMAGSKESASASAPAASASTNTDYQKVAIKRYPQLQQRATAETRYWRKFNFPITVKGYAAVNAINFCPAKPFDFAVSSSTRVCGLVGVLVLFCEQCMVGLCNIVCT